MRAFGERKQPSARSGAGRQAGSLTIILYRDPGYDADKWSVALRATFLLDPIYIYCQSSLIGPADRVVGHPPPTRTIIQCLISNDPPIMTCECELLQSMDIRPYAARGRCVVSRKENDYDVETKQSNSSKKKV
jgi:hypothetical protein